MSLSRIGKRYAKAMLELAVEQKVLDDVRDDMGHFLRLCRESKEFLSMLKSPIISHLKKAEILEKMFTGKVNKLTLQMFSVLSRKNREGVLPNVAEEFLILYNEKKGKQEATVITTFPLDDQMRAAVEGVVKEISGKTPALTEKVNPDILGGFVLTLGDRQIDETLSGKLNDLRLQFKQSSRI